MYLKSPVCCPGPVAPSTADVTSFCRKKILRKVSVKKKTCIGFLLRLRLGRYLFGRRRPPVFIREINRPNSFQGRWMGGGGAAHGQQADTVAPEWK